MKIKSFIALVGFIVFLTSIVAQTPRDIQTMEQEIKGILEDIDSGNRGGGLQHLEFAVALYQQILGRNPSEEELESAAMLLYEKKRAICSHLLNVRRSNLLARLLAKKGNVSTLSREFLAAQLPLLRSLNLETVPFWDAYDIPQTHVDLPEQNLEISAHRGDYKVYYGYLHAHTSYSDGSGTPEEAYPFARDTAKLDFFAITDHGELIDMWPWNNEWDKIKQTAQKYNQDGVFVALHGFEWSSPILGHINVIGSDDFTDCIGQSTVKGICEWIARRPNTFSRFNHPGSYDSIGCEFDHFKLYPFVVEQMAGIEMHNGGKSVQYYFSQKGYAGKFNYMDEANQIGWKLGAVGGQDNHSPDWGMKNNFLVGVWATLLTREGIAQAHRQRRTFATEDRNLWLSFQMDGAQMGSRLTPGIKKVNISLGDKDGEKIAKIMLLKSGTVIQTFESTSDVELTLDTKAGEYYHVFATQEDGNAIISSPIWIVEN